MAFHGMERHATPKPELNIQKSRWPRSIHEGARDIVRDIARTDAYVTSRRQRRQVEMLARKAQAIDFKLRTGAAAQD